MRINLLNAGKRFNREWIFRRFNYEFISGNSYAIIGSNGIGKSTLLQVVATSMTISEGSVSYFNNDILISSDTIYKNISIVAPYIELVEEMTLTEFLIFHNKLKPFYSDLSIKKIIELIGLEKSNDKQLRYYSSGMKQRVKLAQSIFSNVPVVFLDEPSTNLDLEGIDLYKRLIKEYCTDRITIISSNDKSEYDYCNEIINMKDIKKFE